MKKYYFNSFTYGFAYSLISIPLLFYFVLVFFMDDYFNWVFAVMQTILLSSALYIWFYAFVCFTSRMEIDFENKELFILYYFFKKRYKFEDIVSIETKPYNDAAFYIVLKTKDTEKTFLYGKYKTKIWRQSKRVKAELNEFKNDLMIISTKNY